MGHFVLYAEHVNCLEDDLRRSLSQREAEIRDSKEEVPVLEKQEEALKKELVKKQSIPKKGKKDFSWLKDDLNETQNILERIRASIAGLEQQEKSLSRRLQRLQHERTNVMGNALAALREVTEQLAGGGSIPPGEPFEGHLLPGGLVEMSALDARFKQKASTEVTYWIEKRPRALRRVAGVPISRVILVTVVACFLFILLVIYLAVDYAGQGRDGLPAAGASQDQQSPGSNSSDAATDLPLVNQPLLLRGVSKIGEFKVPLKTKTTGFAKVRQFAGGPGEITVNLGSRTVPVTLSAGDHEGIEMYYKKMEAEDSWKPLWMLFDAKRAFLSPLLPRDIDLDSYALEIRVSRETGEADFYRYDIKVVDKDRGTISYYIDSAENRRRNRIFHPLQGGFVQPRIMARGDVSKSYTYKKGEKFAFTVGTFVATSKPGLGPATLRITCRPVAGHTWQPLILDRNRDTGEITPVLPPIPDGKYIIRLEFTGHDSTRVVHPIDLLAKRQNGRLLIATRRIGFYEKK